MISTHRVQNAIVAPSRSQHGITARSHVPEDPAAAAAAAAPSGPPPPEEVVGGDSDSKHTAQVAPPPSSAVAIFLFFLKIFMRPPSPFWGWRGEGWLCVTRRGCPRSVRPPREENRDGKTFSAEKHGAVLSCTRGKRVFALLSRSGDVEEVVVCRGCFTHLGGLSGHPLARDFRRAPVQYK